MNLSKLKHLFFSFSLLTTGVFADNAPFWVQLIPEFARKHIPGLSNSDSKQGPVSYGLTKYEGVTLPLLDAYGPVSLAKVKVDGKTVAHGSLDIKESELNDLEVNGSVSLHSTVVKGHTIISGSLTADTKSEMHDISISTNEMTIRDSVANNIIVRKNNSSEIKHQTVYLEGATQIKGNITFEQGNGEVIIHDPARFDGKVIGGEILRSNS